MKYNHHGRPNRTTKVRNISKCINIHEGPAEADGIRFGDWEMDTLVGKDCIGTIVKITKRNTDMTPLEK